MSAEEKIYGVRPTRRPVASNDETILGSRNGEIDIPRQGLVGDFVGHFDLEPVVALRERRERNALTGLQLVAGRRRTAAATSERSSSGHRFVEDFSAPAAFA
jgi:hypothetical protein